MRFTVDQEKVLETLVYIARRAPGIGRFHAAKAIYFADLFHLRRYGSPITGDTFVAMKDGPVPSFADDVLKGGNSFAEEEWIATALHQIESGHHPAYEARREPDLEFFGKTELAALDAAIDYCVARSFSQLSSETHHHKAWEEATRDSAMSFDTMLEGVDPQIKEDAEEFASHGAL